MDEEKSLLTVEEVAHSLHCAESTVTKRLRAGMLPGFKIGKVWRIKRDEFDAWCIERSGLSRGDRPRSVIRKYARYRSSPDFAKTG